MFAASAICGSHLETRNPTVAVARENAAISTVERMRRFHETPPQDVHFVNRRLAREWRTIEAMIRCYCQDHHNTRDALCPECQQLQDYAAARLERCRFGAEKPTCANCPVHCYQKARREQVKVLMRYAGPRMLWQHPVLSLIHWLDGFRKAPKLA
jgi:Nitrous oxide-stimulated promoter